MSYQEIDLDLIDPNPFQTRESYDEEKLAGIMGTAMDELGIRYTPMVRPHPEKPGRYQLASGWGRYLAMKALKWEKHIFRIEKLSDAQMKKEVLVENVNRSDLTEKELLGALEQYREDLGLEPGEPGFISKLHQATGMPETTLYYAYDLKKMRDEIRVQTKIDAEEPSAWVIQSTEGLETEDRVKLVVKAQDRGWSGRTVREVKTVLRDMAPEVRALILSEEIKLTPKTITALTEIEDPKLQAKAVQWISGVGLGEEQALRYIAQVQKGDVREETIIIDEIEDTLKEFEDTRRKVLTWGINHYMLLGGLKWSESKTIFDTIEKQMQWLKRDGFLKNVAKLGKNEVVNAKFTDKDVEESE